MAFDKKQVLTVAKKNALSITAGVIALVAICVPFFWVDKLVTETKSNLDARKSFGSSVESLASKARTLPQLDPDVTEAKPLEVFPTANVIAAGDDAVKKLSAQTEAVVETVIKLNKHTPLVPEVFTVGLTGTKAREFAYKFRDEYLKMMQTGLDARINAALAPTQADVAQALQSETARIQNEKTTRQNGAITNAAEVTALINKAQTDVPVALRNDVALGHKLYVNATSWSVSPSIGEKAQTADLIWLAQVGLWVQQDVATVIADANAKSTNVFDSTVKHLIQVSVPQQPYVIASTPMVEGIGGGGTPVSGNNPSAAITLDPMVSVTGRSGNGLYDVVHFKLTVRVAESKVAEFLSTIPHNRLMYVLKVDMTAVDSAAELESGYLYGNEPVVQLAIDVEELFLRKWTADIMPLSIKQLVGIEPPPVAAPAG